MPKRSREDQLIQMDRSHKRSEIELDKRIMKSVVVLSLAALAGLVVGCSSSEEPSATSSASPTVTSSSTAVSSDPNVNAILEKSCYGCHSTGGTVPWYAAVSPTHLAASSARETLNFSEWQGYDAEKRAAEMKSIAQAVSGDSMPPGDYTALDHSARLSPDEKQALLNWASQLTAASHRTRN